MVCARAAAPTTTATTVMTLRACPCTRTNSNDICDACVCVRACLCHCSHNNSNHVCYVWARAAAPTATTTATTFCTCVCDSAAAAAAAITTEHFGARVRSTPAAITKRQRSFHSCPNDTLSCRAIPPSNQRPPADSGEDRARSVRSSEAAEAEKTTLGFPRCHQRRVFWKSMRATGGGRGIVPTGRTWFSGGDSEIEFRSVPFSILESSPGIRPGNIWTRFVDRISVCSVFCPRIGPGGRVWTALGHPLHEISVCSGSHSGMHCPAPPERGNSRLNPKPRGSGGLVADAVAQRTGLSWTCESCREVKSEMRAFMRQTRSGFKDLSVGFNKLNAQFLAVDAQFNSLKLLAESPKRKKSTPRDLQTTAISQFSTVEQFLTPTTPSAPQTMFATPIASMDVDIPIVDAVPTDTASSVPLSDSSAVVKKRTSRPKPNIAPPPVIVTAGSPRVRKTGMLVDKPTRVRTRPLRSTENIAAVAENVREQPSTSTRHRSQQLDISRTSLIRILHKDLAMKPYKVQLVQQLKPIDHPNRLLFANWVADRLAEDENPHIVVEKPKHPPRVTVWCGFAQKYAANKVRRPTTHSPNAGNISFYCNIF
ncbi:hypothetical protein ACLKA7_000827 [Drosophila subpalustris]